MAKPMKTLELHYPMIQFLIKLDIEWENHQLSQLEITGYRIFRPKINGMRDTQTTDNGPLFWRCTRPIKMFCCYCICGVGNMTTTPTPTPTLTGQILYLLLLPWDVNDSMLPENLLQEKKQQHSYSESLPQKTLRFSRNKLSRFPQNQPWVSTVQ